MWPLNTASLQFRNKDDLCFEKALVKGLYREGGPLKHSKNKSIQNENKILDDRAKQWLKRVGVPEGKVSSESFPKFQAELHNIRLVIYSMRYANSFIFDGCAGLKDTYDWECLFSLPL